MRSLSRFVLSLPGALLLCQGCVSTPATSNSSSSPAADGAAVANLNLGAAYFRQGQLTLALERLDRALDHDPRLAKAHSTIAMVYDQLGDVDEARDHHRRAIRLAPNDPRRRMPMAYSFAATSAGSTLSRCSCGRRAIDVTTPLR